MAAVLYPLILALIPLSVCKYASLFGIPLISCAWAQPAGPDQPAAPAQPQESQGAPQQPQGQQEAPKQPEAAPAPAAPAAPAQSQEGQGAPQQPQGQQAAPKQPEAAPAPAAPAAPAQPQEGQGAPQQPQGQQPAPKQPEAPPAGPPQPLPSEQKKKETEAPKKPPELQLEETIIDIVHRMISKDILSTATYLDSFFGNERYLAEANQSYIRLRYNMFLEHESPFLHRPEIDVRVVLPQLQQKTHLEFSGTPKNAADLSATQAPSTIDQFENPSQKNFTTSISQFFKQSDKVNFVMRGGLQWHGGGPEVILGPRFRLLVPLYDQWSFRFIEDVVVRTNNNGYQIKSTFDLERPLPHNLFFRATNDWIRTDHMDGFTYTAIFTVDHPLDAHHILAYEYDNLFQTRPVNELTEIDLRVRYRQRFWRDWFFFEVAPQYRFPRDRDFVPTPGILFRLEAIFGHY